jgi:hypothetical protein
MKIRTALENVSFYGGMLLICFLLAFGGAQQPARAQVTTPGLRTTPLGYCQLATLSSSIGLASCVRSAFTGTGSGTNLTTTSVTGIIKVGDTVTGTGVPAGTTIVSQTSGTTGGAGVYVTSAATTSSSASLTGGGIPAGTTLAFLQAEAQAVQYRDDGGAPTSSVGMPLASGASLLYAGTFSALRVIEKTSGAKVNILFYK